MNLKPVQPFAMFYDEVRDRVFRAVLASGRHPIRAEDAVADAFLKAFERWDSVGSMTSPTAWVVRVALNQYNSDWRIWRRELPDPPEGDGVSADHPSDSDLLELVWRLPRRQRQAIALRVLADLSEQDAADALGISAKTVSVHLHRALATLRTDMAAAQKEKDPWTTQTSPAK